MDKDKLIRALTITADRFRAMRNDYARQLRGGRTILIVDTCDILTYMHTDERKPPLYPQRAAMSLFDDETHERVLLAPHAYELLRFIRELAKQIEDWSHGDGLQSEYPSPVTEFLEAGDQGNWDKAARIWKEGGWSVLLRIAKAASYTSVPEAHNPFSRLLGLLDDKKLNPIEDVDLPLEDAGVATGDDDTVERVLRAFASMNERADKPINNMVDARALAIAVDLNQRISPDTCYFSLTTLSPASLTAYARSRPADTTGICRNTIVSAYRRNMLGLEYDCARQLEYMMDGVGLLESVIARYDSVMSAEQRGADSDGMPNGIASDTLRFMADYLDYYNLYFKKLVEPTAAGSGRSTDIEELQEMHELLDDGKQLAESLRAAHIAILTQAREMEPKLRPFVMGRGGRRKKAIRMGAKTLNEMFDDIVRAIEE